MSVRGRIVAVLGLLIGLGGILAAVVAVQFWHQQPVLHAVDRQTGELADHGVTLLLTAKAIKNDVVQVQQWLTDISATRGQDGLNDGFDKAEAYAQDFQRDIAKAKADATALNLPEVVAALEQTATAFPAYYETGKKMARAYIDHGPAGGNPMMGEFDGAAEHMTGAVDALTVSVEAFSEQALIALRADVRGLRDDNRSALVWIIALAALGAVVGFGGAFYLYRLTGGFINGLLEDLEKVASRSPDTRLGLNMRRNDEIGAVARALAEFRQGLVDADRLTLEQDVIKRRAEEERRETLLKLANELEQGVSKVVETVASAATEMHATAEVMSSTASDASQLSDAAAAAAEQASSNVQTVAGAAEELTASIRDIGERVTRSSSIAQQAADDAAETDRRIQALAASAAAIGDVVTLINDIASQTNLLALNATIEAARAGEAGKGFAVVANEVKNLANQTARATDDIARQVATVQGETKEAVAAIQHIAATINQVNEIAASIAAAVDQQSSATQDIARNVAEASAGTQEVSASIDGVKRAAGEAGQAAAQVVVAADDLSRQAEMLRSTVDHAVAQIRAS